MSAAVAVAADVLGAPVFGYFQSVRHHATSPHPRKLQRLFPNATQRNVNERPTSQVNLSVHACGTVFSRWKFWQSRVCTTRVPGSHGSNSGSSSGSRAIRRLEADGKRKAHRRVVGKHGGQPMPLLLPLTGTHDMYECLSFVVVVVDVSVCVCLYGPGPMRRNARTRKMRINIYTYTSMHICMYMYSNVCKYVCTVIHLRAFSLANVCAEYEANDSAEYSAY